MSISPARPTLVKSKLRVADHGGLFTPVWIVEDMLDLVKNEIFIPIKSYPPMTAEEIAA